MPKLGRKLRTDLTFNSVETGKDGKQIGWIGHVLPRYRVEVLLQSAKEKVAVLLI